MTKHMLVFATAALLAAAPATAADFVFQVTGGGALDSYSFTAPARPVPVSSTAHSFSLFDVASFGDIGFGPIDYLANYSFYDAMFGGGFDGGYTINVYSGPVLFAGPTSAPRFKVGTYSFTDIYGQATTLTIAGVPEPTSWALMIAGFGLSGMALRRRERTRQPLSAT